MRSIAIKQAALALAVAFACAAGTASAGETPKEEKPASPACLEYYSAQVLIIDHREGYLGVITMPEKDDEEPVKVSFPVDKKEIEVTNQIGDSLPFEVVRVGDHIDFFAEKYPDGVYRVNYILDYNRFEKR
jgi:hypothetical protein